MASEIVPDVSSPATAASRPSGEVEVTLGAAQVADIADRGFVYVPSFLNDEEIELLKRDFEAVPAEPNANYQVRRVSSQVRPTLEAKCQAIARAVQQQTDVRVNMINDAVYFATFTNARTLASPGGKTQKFAWHQDHENYWQWQDVYNYLNFFIPILKPNVEQSNLGVVPFDRLKERDPELFSKVLGRGATRILHRGRHWVITNDHQGGRLAKLNWDISELEEVPQLKAGDLLLLRGDVIHRTQDASSRRIAVSIRMSNRETTVSRAMLAQGGFIKSVMMFSARSLFEPVFEFFDATDRDSAQAGDLLQFLDERKQAFHQQGVAPPKCSRTQFVRRLIREKWRARFR